MPNLDENGQPIQTPDLKSMGWGGWNADNVFNNWDLNPLASTIGGGANGVRDTLSTERDAYLQPQMQAYRNAATQAGTRADTTDQTLFGDQNFQNFVRTGQTNFAPQNATPSQQWTTPQSATQPALPVTGDTGDMASKQSGLFDMLMERMKQPITPDRNDPTIRGQADAFSANTERSKRSYLADLAEKSGPFANLNADTRLASEHAGQASGAFEAQLMGREQDARRASIQHDFDLYGSQMSDQERLQLQEELGLLDAQNQKTSIGNQYALGMAGNATNRRGQDQSYDQFMRELALREANQNNQWEYNWATM